MPMNTHHYGKCLTYMANCFRASEHPLHGTSLAAESTCPSDVASSEHNVPPSAPPSLASDGGSLQTAEGGVTAVHVQDEVRLNDDSDISEQQELAPQPPPLSAQQLSVQNSTAAKVRWLENGVCSKCQYDANKDPALQPPRPNSARARTHFSLGSNGADLTQGKYFELHSTTSSMYEKRTGGQPSSGGDMTRPQSVRFTSPMSSNTRTNSSSMRHSSDGKSSRLTTSILKTSHTDEVDRLSSTSICTDYQIISTQITPSAEPPKSSKSTSMPTNTSKYVECKRPISRFDGCEEEMRPHTPHGRPYSGGTPHVAGHLFVAREHKQRIAPKPKAKPSPHSCSGYKYFDRHSNCINHYHVHQHLLAHRPRKMCNPSTGTRCPLDDTNLGIAISRKDRQLDEHEGACIECDSAPGSSRNSSCRSQTFQAITKRNGRPSTAPATRKEFSMLPYGYLDRVQDAHFCNFVQKLHLSQSPHSAKHRPDGASDGASDGTYGPGHDVTYGPGHDGTYGPGHDIPGHDRPGHDSPGHDSPGHVSPGHVSPGHDSPGHDNLLDDGSDTYGKKEVDDGDKSGYIGANLTGRGAVAGTQTVRSKMDALESTAPVRYAKLNKKRNKRSAGAKSTDPVSEESDLDSYVEDLEGIAEESEMARLAEESDLAIAEVIRKRQLQAHRRSLKTLKIAPDRVKTGLAKVKEESRLADTISEAIEPALHVKTEPLHVKTERLGHRPSRAAHLPVVPADDDIPLLTPSSDIKTPGTQSPISTVAFDMPDEPKPAVQLPESQEVVHGKYYAFPDSLDDIHVHEEKPKKPKMQPWLHGRLALSMRSSRFSLPMNMQELEVMTPSQYLTQYVHTTSRRMTLYDKMFIKHRTKVDGLSIKEMEKALKEVLVNTAKAHDLEKILDMVKIDATTLVSQKLFAGVAAMAERLLITRSLMNAAHPDDKTKGNIELADFCGLEWKLKGLNINPDIRRIIQSV